MIIFNLGMQGECNTVEDYQELDTALRRLVKGLDASKYKLHTAGLSCTVDEDLRADEAVQNMKLRSKIDVGIIADPQR